MDLDRLEPALRSGLDGLGLLPKDFPGQQALTQRLLAYLALLVRWNATYNLTAIREPERMLTHHLLDCAAIAPPLHEMLAAKFESQQPLRVVDVGSGAGLPGVVLAILWPHARVLLVEPVGKKAAFLRQVAGELALTNVEVAAMRIEAHAPEVHDRAPDVVVCRAFAPLADYTTAIAPIVGEGTRVAAMKATASDDEVAALPPGWQRIASVALQVPGLDAQRHLVVLARAPVDALEPPRGAPDDLR